MTVVAAPDSKIDNNIFNLGHDILIPSQGILHSATHKGKGTSTLEQVAAPDPEIAKIFSFQAMIS